MPQHPGLKPGLNNSGISPWQLFQEFNWWHEKAHKTTRWEPSCPTREVNSAVMSEFSPLLPEPCLALLNTVGGWRCYISEVLVPSRLGGGPTRGRHWQSRQAKTFLLLSVSVGIITCQTRPFLCHPSSSQSGPPWVRSTGGPQFSSCSSDTNPCAPQPQENEYLPELIYPYVVSFGPLFSLVTYIIILLSQMSCFEVPQVLSTSQAEVIVYFVTQSCLPVVNLYIYGKIKNSC